MPGAREGAGLFARSGDGHDVGIPVVAGLDPLDDALLALVALLVTCGDAPVTTLGERV